MTKSSLPKGWRFVKFGDVVDNMNETTRDPEAVGLDRVVGLDHMDPQSLPLKRWDNLSDLHEGTSFTRVFRAGQVLFGKRRAYQRKVSLPDFDGICSGDILVFQAKNAELLPEFLPYLVQSDGFFDHALGTSAGSLSPRTKWQELAKYEFALPPIVEQRRMAELIVSIDNTIVSYEALELEVLESALVTEWLSDTTIASFTMDLKDLVQNGLVELGRGDVISKKDIDETPGDFPVYSSAQQDDGKIGSYGKYMFDEELITWSIDGGGHIFHRPKHKFSVTNIGGYLRILVQERISYQYLAVVLKELHRREIFDWQNKAHPSVLQKKYKGIPIPTIDVQNILVEKLASIQLLRSTRNLNVVNLKQMRKSFLSDALA